VARLATVEDLKGYLDIEDQSSAKESLLTSMLEMAEVFAERYARRRFSPLGEDDADVTLTRSTYGKRLVWVPDLREITDLQLSGTTLTSDYYDLGFVRDTPATTLRLSRWIPPALAFSVVPGSGTVGLNDLTITGKWGFAECPQDVRHAVLAIAARSWRLRDAAWADEVRDYEGGQANYHRHMPVDARAILETYRPRMIGIL
jgi:hypothetical protein